MRDAGHYSLPLVWALDRMAREGPLDTLQVVDRFAKLGVQVVSHQEPWTEASGEFRDHRGLGGALRVCTPVGAHEGWS